MTHVKVIARNPIVGRNDGTRSPALSSDYCIHPQTPCDLRSASVSLKCL